jgi:dTDP-4-amino-4,6-dideoxy-D-glucose acyltransferase
MSWLTRNELIEMGFGSLGENVLLSGKASYYNTQNIHLGNNVRIDDFCIISAGEGGIRIGRNVHISAFSSVVGQAPIDFEDFSGISNKVSVFSSTDDFAKGMTNPTVPDRFRRLKHLPVRLGKHAIVGANCVVLPGSDLAEGTAVGALSVVRGKLEPWTVYLGNPIKRIMSRSQSILDLEQELLLSEQNEIATLDIEQLQFDRSLNILATE